MNVYCFLRKIPGWTLLLDGGRLLIFWQNSRVDALIKWWTLINFDNKFQGGRLFQRGRLLDREEYLLKPGRGAQENV